MSIIALEVVIITTFIGVTNTQHRSFKRFREFSSAGSEHLPYKQRVGGSNPSTPTNHNTTTLMSGFFGSTENPGGVA